MAITWNVSGQGPVDLTLADAQHLAIEAGFIFPGTEGAPPSKRANLQGMHYLHQLYAL